MAKKIVVTGAGGYIGSIATYLFLEKGYEVVALDNFTTGYRGPIEVLQKKYDATKLRFYKVDLTGDISDVFKQEKEIGAVVHFAASCIVDESMKNPAKYFSNNIISTLHLLDAMVKHKIKNIIFSSTTAVYGEAREIPINEEHPRNPVNVYGESKKMVEDMIVWYQKLFDIHFVVLRYFNVCGASDDGLIGDSKKPSTLLVQNAVRGALGIAPFYLTCPKVNTPDKTPIRDYINVVDLSEAHLMALSYLEENGKSDFFNIGTGTGNSVLEVVAQVEKATAKKIEVGETTPRQGDPEKLIADITKAKNTLKWSPKRTIEDSVKSLITWYSSHPHGWDR